MTRTIGPRNLVPLIPALTRRAEQLTGSRTEAEDLVQDTLLKLCQRLHDGSQINDLNAQAMRDLSKQARQRKKPDITDKLKDDHALTEPDAPLRLDCVDALAAISDLPKPQRQLMELVVAGETSPRGLSDATGLPLGTVMSRLARARAKLRVLLSDEMPKPLSSDTGSTAQRARQTNPERSGRRHKGSQTDKSRRPKHL